MLVKKLVQLSVKPAPFLHQLVFSLLILFFCFIDLFLLLHTELNIADKLIADFFVLDDVARSELFEYLQIMKRNHSDPERKKIIKSDKPSKKKKR